MDKWPAYARLSTVAPAGHLPTASQHPANAIPRSSIKPKRGRDCARNGGRSCERFDSLFLTQLIELYQAGRLAFFGTQAGLADRRLFLRRLAAVRKKRFVVYAKPPFAGPEAVLAYLARYTHRVAISNRRLIAFDETGVTFRYKDYRRDGAERQRVMTLAPHEFIRRFLLHVLPRGFHRIRHYGLLASSARKANIARARELLGVVPPPEPVELPEPLDHLPPCPCCGGRMFIIETFERWRQPRAPPHASAPTGSVPS